VPHDPSLSADSVGRHFDILSANITLLANNMMPCVRDADIVSRQNDDRHCGWTV